VYNERQRDVKNVPFLLFRSNVSNRATLRVTGNETTPHNVLIIFR
jgi:hypothetical protein